MEIFSHLSSPSPFWTVCIIAVFVICVFAAGVLIPQILLISFRRKLFDVPDGRKIHKGLIPRLGGIAFKPVVFFSMALALGGCELLGFSCMRDALNEESLPLSFGFCAIMLLYLVGVADDLIGIRYRAKFVAHIACGLMAIAGGLCVHNLYGLLFIHALPEWVGWLTTVFAVVFVINAANLIDGIDGLASGLFGAASLFYGVILFMAREYIFSMLAFATLGVLIPFFYYNVFGDARRGNKIFMGDTGSQTIGMMLCILSLEVLHCVPADAPEGMPNTFVLAFSPLIVPCFDVVRVYIHRVRKGHNPFLPDKSHIHHKLLALGMPQHTAMVTIVAVSVGFTAFNIFVSTCIDLTLVLVLDVTLWTVGNILLTRSIRRKMAKDGKTIV